MKRAFQIAALQLAVITCSYSSSSHAQLIPQEAMLEIGASPTFVTSILIDMHSSIVADSLVSEVGAQRKALTDKELKAALGVLEKSVNKTRLFFEKLQKENDAEYQSLLAKTFPQSNIRPLAVPNLPRFLAWARDNQRFYVLSASTNSFAKVYHRFGPKEKPIPFCPEIPEDKLTEQGMSAAYRRGLRCVLNSKELEEVVPLSLNFPELRAMEQKTRLEAISALGSSDAFRFGSPFDQFFTGLNATVIPKIQERFRGEIKAFHAEQIDAQKSLLKSAWSS